ncbi:MAG: hydantoinase/oxoprolinase family protein [Candidatus Eremiobacteraeota bacterium]|nr:hydantoinase/oxoprolinase family protein [Candidatus Eremiobacteraeota bacterium]MBV8354488.1 hydantoinase/oxoprolinase family protein [Candidatus Eremiobacteraeota bacterium]
MKEHALGVDIGGTFTDLVLLDSARGALAVGKVLTNYDDLANPVVRGTEQVLRDRKLPGDAISRVVHGTTLVTNALIQRHGAQTALITTRGFRDVLEFGRESRYDIYAIDIEIPPPLVPRHLVFEVGERLDYEGNVVEPLDEENVRAIAQILRERKVGAVAICLLHAYRNGAHEERIAQILSGEVPEIAVSLSSHVMPDIREFERACTTVANAYVRPAIRGYLERLSSELRNVQVKAPLLLMTSDGGTISAQTAVAHPIRLVESGPAGGAIAASYIGKEHGLERVLAYDMGGTTAKICVIDGGKPEHTDQFEFGRVFRFAKGSGLPLNVPALEMIEIGAGGGSIAHVDAMGRLRIGPESAGASPGPACYGLGGTVPTVTDADLVLGYLGAESFLGGTMMLDRKAAVAAIERSIAKPLDLTTTRAAWGVHEVVNDNMARAAKIHCLERGKAPKDYTLVAYGGAGPVHAYGIARALGIRSIVYPLRAGVMSAFGFLVAPPSFELLRAVVMPFDALPLREVNAILKAMVHEGRGLVRTAGVAASACIVRRELTIRFKGQSFELSVPISAGTVTEHYRSTIRARFLAMYRERFHRLNPDVPLEVVKLRVIVSGPQRRIHVQSNGKTRRRAKKGERQIYVPQRRGFVRGPVYDRYALSTASRLRGPAMIEEAESTVFLGPDAIARVARNGNLVVTIQE